MTTVPTTAEARYNYTPLRNIVRDLSYRVGDFTLASGAKATEYVDVKNALLHPHARTKIAEAMERLIKSTAGLRYATCVAGPELGAIPLAVAVSDAAARNGYSMPTLMVRKRSKDHGTKALVDGLSLVAPGDAVVLVEDVFTTGASSASALEALLAAGLNPVGAVCVVDREQGANTLIGGTYGIPVCRLMTLDQVRNARHDCMEYRPRTLHKPEFTCPVDGRKWRLDEGGMEKGWDEVFLHDATQLGLPGVT